MRHSATANALLTCVKSTRFALLASGLFVATLATVGCGERQESTSTVKHDADQPTRGTEAWMWKAAPENQFRTIMEQLLGIAADNYLPGDHALVQRTQLWVDRLDAQLRAAHPDALVNVPRPKAQVLKDGSTNAFVAPVPVCYKLPVKFGSGTATPATTVDTVYMDLSKGGLGQWPADINCLEGSTAVATLTSVVAKFNSTSVACKYTVTNSGSLVPGAGCSLDADLAGKNAAKSVAFFHTAGFITVHTGLFPAMSEEAFVSVLAHELGHYYRSHTSSSETEFDFFYTMSQSAAPSRPVADPSLRELGEGAVMSSTLLNASETYRTIAGATMRPELFFSAGSIVLGACAAGSCPAACGQARDFINSDEFETAIGTFPFGRAAAGEASAYASFETKTLACLAKLNMVSTAGTLTATTVSWDKITTMVQAPTWPTWLAQISPSAQRQLAKMAQLAALRLGNDAPSGTTAKAAFAGATAALKQQDTESVALLKQAVDQRLGQYTIEQEADDEAAEWVAETGIDPKFVVEAMHSLGRGTETAMGGMILGESDCDALWNNDWLDANGAYVFVPIGDYSEIHHSVCYRMFNLEREIAAHEHERADVQAPLLPAAQWRTLQTQADGLAGSTNESRGSAQQVHPLAERTGIMSCPYSYKYH